MKKFFLSVLALALGVSAADQSLEERVGGLQEQVDRVMSKAGIHFNGEFRGQFLNSQVSGSAVVDTAKKNESVEFTSVDFDIVARPNTALSARAIFRLHQDWRNFFSDIQNPIATRWLSIDGAVAEGMIKYNVGDYRKKISPLTLWSPDMEMLLEPEIFAAARRYAMSESFLGENKRMLQGFNLEFDAELYPVLKQVRADIFGARLAARGTLESAILPIGAREADFDKYLTGVNLATQVKDGLGFGITNITIFDYITSFNGNEAAAKRDDPQLTSVFAGRMNIDNRLFMSDELIRIDGGLEFAYSHDKKYYNLPTSDGDKLVDSAFTGIAFNGLLSARYSLGGEDYVKLGVSGVYNEKDFRNDAVQTPSFIQRRVMNNENELENLGLLNPFDAMYRTVYKYAPSQYFGGTNPQSKHAYNNAILTQFKVGSLEFDNRLAYPSIFQTALPGGMSTADRMGPIVNLDAKLLDNALTVAIKALRLETLEEDETHFTEAAGGAKLDVAKFMPAVGRSLIIGASYGMYNAYHGSWESQSSLIGAELNYSFHPRFSVLAGYQMLDVSVGDGNNAEYLFDNLAFGIGYKVADGGNLVVKLTRVSGKDKVAEKSYRAVQPEAFLTVKF